MPATLYKTTSKKKIDYDFLLKYRNLFLAFLTLEISHRKWQMTKTKTTY